MSPVGLAARLEMMWPIGDFPLVRRRLYRRLEQLACNGDGVAHRIITECGLAAKQKQRPGVWFAAAVTRRLAEAGYPASEGVAAVVAAKQRAVESLAQHFSPREDSDHAQ